MKKNKRIVCFSTGNLYKSFSSIHKKIDFCSDLDVDGIELLFAYAQDLLKFKLKKSQLAKLRKFKYNTIHLPFYKDKKKNYFYWFNTKDCKKLMYKAYSIAKQINAVNLNMHANQLKNPKLMDDFKDLDYTFENITEKYRYTISDYKKVLKQNPRANFLFDVSHGIRTNQLEDIAKNFKNKIKFIHLSGAKGPKDDHYLLYKFNHPNKKRLELVKTFDCPVIIEAGREKGVNLSDFKKEINYVKKWLN